MAGIFITFEGGEGSGKSTQIQKLATALQQEGRNVLLTREPGGTAVGKLIRDILLNGAHETVDPLAELLLYAADRAQHMQEIVRPSLQKNRIVLCDRFTDATVAYQGWGRGLDLGIIEKLNLLATGGLQPKLTLLLDLPVEIGLSRSKHRLKQEGSSEDRFENETLAFHQKVRAGYLKLARAEPDRFRVFDAILDIEALHQKILREIQALTLPSPPRGEGQAMMGRFS